MPEIRKSFVEFVAVRMCALSAVSSALSLVFDQLLERRFQFESSRNVSGALSCESKRAETLRIVTQSAVGEHFSADFLLSMNFAIASYTTHVNLHF